MRICSIDGCNRIHKAHGWCGAHYGMWREHGDPLASTTGWGEALRFYREVVLPYDGTECLMWPFSRDERGYGRLNVVRNGKRVPLPVSHIVCEDAHGPAPTSLHEAAHSCGRGHLACVAKRHVSWKTHAENMAEMVDHGTSPRGERNGFAKINTETAIAIRAAPGLQRDIANQFGVDPSTVSRIKNGASWAWLEA